jgi:hypothetical protein
MSTHLGLNDAEIGYLNRAVKTIAEEGGRLMISYEEEKGVWITGMEWGKEAEDSDMAGAAAYGLQDTLESSLGALVEDAGR